MAEVETAKTMVEVPSPHAGVVAELHAADGSDVAVGAALITVDTGERTEHADSAASAYVTEERAGSGNVLVGYGTAAPGTGRRWRRGHPPGATALRRDAAAGLPRHPC
ncbi:hypothetical protein BAY59_34855 [Prauserella coralliicola]|nr:hypothetical protein BAY59_34855 [Prauserella coralliicola]